MIHVITGDRILRHSMHSYSRGSAYINPEQYYVWVLGGKGLGKGGSIPPPPPPPLPLPPPKGPKGKGGVAKGPVAIAPPIPCVKYDPNRILPYGSWVGKLSYAFTCTNHRYERSQCCPVLNL